MTTLEVDTEIARHMSPEALKEEELSEGDTLHNGATVEDAVVCEWRKDGLPRLSVVLAEYQENWVVWLFNHETGGCSSGNYIRHAYADALKQYARKIERYSR